MPDLPPVIGRRSRPSIIPTAPPPPVQADQQRPAPSAPRAPGSPDRLAPEVRPRRATRGRSPSSRAAAGRSETAAGAQARYAAKGRRLIIPAVPEDVAAALDIMFDDQREMPGGTRSFAEFLRRTLADVVDRHEAAHGPVDRTRAVRKSPGAPRLYG